VSIKTWNEGVRVGEKNLYFTTRYPMVIPEIGDRLNSEANRKSLVFDVGKKSTWEAKRSFTPFSVTLLAFQGGSRTKKDSGAILWCRRSREVAR